MADTQESTRTPVRSTAAWRTGAQPLDELTEWVCCQGCQIVLYGPRLLRDLGVCHFCGHHHRLSATARITQLFDGDCEVHPPPGRSADVLRFSDSKPYPQRLADARAATGLDEGVLLAEGTIGGQPVIAVVMDFAFMGGSLGTAIGTAVVEAADRALARRVPLLVVCASGGARMQEGTLALMQMAATAQALRQLDEAGILTISLITDPTYGGVAASYATLCDVILAEPGARLGFAGPRVIEQTIKEQLPAGFQTAEFLLENGLIDLIRPRQALRAALSRLLSIGARPSGSRPVPVPDGEHEAVVRDPELLPPMDAWESMREARDLGRLTTLDHVDWVFQDFMELRGDRLAGRDAVVGGFAWLADSPLVVVGHQKGKTPAELAARNYGMATPKGHRKAGRLMRTAAKLGLPVVTFIDTPGAYPGIQAEQDGQAAAIAESIRLMSGLPVPIVAVLIGEGGSGGALAFGVADEVLMLSSATYSVISPEGCASILWRDASRAPEAAEALHLDARSLLRLGVVDAVIPASTSDAAADHATTTAWVRQAVTGALHRASGLDVSELLSRRAARFRSFAGVGSRSQA